MERYMYQDDTFERMLKQKADEYRMYPSDDSWNKIQQKLRNKNNFNWKGAFFLTTLLVSLSLYVSVHQDYKATAKMNTPASTLETPSNKAFIAKASTPVFKTRKSGINRSTSFSVKPTPNLVSNKTETTANEKTIAVVVETSTININELTAKKENTDEAIAKVEQLYRLSSPVPPTAETGIPQQQLNITAKENTAPLADENKTDADLNYEVDVPVTIKQKPAKQFQFYITPSASYRVLISENKYSFGNLQQNAESAVSHNSSIGFEAGAAITFPISNRLQFRTGIQFNRTQYIVTASKYIQEPATVTLNSAPTTLRQTNLRTSNGYFPEDIANKTTQLSIPIGLELKLAGTQKLSWYFGAAVQPTYQLSATGYLVTGDLKNYIKAPDLLSRMNVNSGLETFFRWGGYKNFELQAGPQLRYQLFSNSKGKYPVQEHLVDYGFKIGFIKTLR